MSLTLYGLSHSRSFRCLWALCETRLDFDYKSVAFDNSDAEHSATSASYLSKNKQGKVPTLEHDDFVLTESTAILNYINALSEQTLIPTDRRARARYDELCSFIITELEQPLWTNGKHRFALPAEHRVKEIFPTAEFEFDKAVTALDHLLSSKEYAIENRFSMADILLAQTIHWADRFKFSIPPTFLNYRDEMYSRPAAVRALDLIE